MKFRNISWCVSLAVWGRAALFSPWNIAPMAAMTMNNMLMGNTLESFLSELVSFNDITEKQKDQILRMGNASLFGSSASVGEDGSYRTDFFATEQSKQELRAYLYTEVGSGAMEEDAAEGIAAMLSLGGLYVSAAMSEFIAMDAPVQASYSGEGNMERLGRSNLLASTSTSFYNGIWGYATGEREYALQCHGQGFSIIDVTDPGNTFRIQFVAMEGGGYWRDTATYYDEGSSKTYAYVGAQGTQGGGFNPNLFVFDLSYLSGDINNPNSPNSNPIPSGSGYLNLGETGYTHTLNVGKGLLFLNDAGSTQGCRVYDITSDPMSPQFLFRTGGSGKQCHDSSVINVDGTDVLIASDGNGRRNRFYDITNVDASWPVNQVPPLIGQTDQISGIYAHSNWVTEDNRYMFGWDENNVIDTSVHDISDLSNPVQINSFQYSGDAGDNAIPHNGMIRGQYLYIAYYQAGLRVFDISNPYEPLEVGKVETHRDPNDDGVFTESISADFEGAWNLYPFLPSGNILVNDMFNGLFIVRANSPYTDGAPSAPIVSVERDGSDNVVLSWSNVANVRGYSVERSATADGVFTKIAEHMTTTSFVDESVRGVNAFYKIKAVNGEGAGSSPVLSAVIGPTQSPTPLPTTSPTPPAPPTPPPTPFPTTSPTLSPISTRIEASFDSSRGAPMCDTAGTSCDSGESLLAGRGNVGPEGNQPNTIGSSCSDGNSGSYQSDESLDRVVIKTTDGTFLKIGSPVEIEARVYAWSTGTSDYADFFYSANADDNWVHIGNTKQPSGGGFSTITSDSFQIQGDASIQAVRVVFKYSSTSNPSFSACPGGSYDDVDDLIFTVLPDVTAAPTTSQPTSPYPTRSPSRSPTMSPSSSPTRNPTRSPTLSPTPAPVVPTFQPTTAQPTTSQPTTSQPTTSQPTTSQPTTSQPTTSQPTSSQPTTSPIKTPTTSPTASPTTNPTKSPTLSPTKNPTPTTNQPTTSQPTTGQPTTSQPTTAQPTPNPTPQPTNPSPSQSPTPAPTPSPVQTPVGPVEAVYDASFGAPRCAVVGSGCTSLSLLDGRGTNGPEPNQPNVISTCSDGGSGAYHSDESLDRIVVESSDENGVPNGEPLKAFSTATITASVWAWTTFSNDFADFFYASDASNPTWVYIGTAQPDGSGAQEVKMTYTLPAGDNQAVRVNFRFNGVASSCSGGSYDDADDLVFAVKSGTAAPTSSPTPAPTNSPIKQTNGGPQEAVFDSSLGFPACEFYGSSCDSLEYLDGRGNVGPETNAPNTYTLDECNDGNSGQYHSDESLDKIVVMASDVDGNSIDGDMEEGGYATILAGVWAWSTGSSDRADFYYASDASNPSWNYLGTKTPPSGGAQQLTWTYQLPQGQFQAVRVVFRYGGSEVPSSSCTVGSYNDFDDLGFGVKQNSSFQLGSTSDASDSDQSKNNNGQNGSEEKVKVEPKENSKGNNGGGNASGKEKGENNRPKI